MDERHDVMVAADRDDALCCRFLFPHLLGHVLLTPERPLPPERSPFGFVVRSYVWTPAASKLPASVRMRLRGELSSLIDERSMEEEFPSTLLSW
jgi:hypothetical protein